MTTINDLPKDIWQVIIKFIDSPKDYKNVCIISKTVHQVSLKTRYQKSIEFSKPLIDWTNYYHTVTGRRYYILPNYRIHGWYEEFELSLQDYTLIVTKLKLFYFGSEVHESEWNHSHRPDRTDITEYIIKSLHIDQ